MGTAFLQDPIFLTHDTGPGHPERAARLQALAAALQREPWYGDLVRLAPRVAERRWVETIHSAAYIERAEQACRAGWPFLDVADVAICPSSFEVALQAVGAALELGDAVANGQVQNAMAALRPPGHHAERDLALGFCLFNNVAILARYLQQHHGIGKVLILDWDVHHGNGTQHSFYEDPSVLYISVHQYPYYPGTGAASETGQGRGAGYTLNCPLPAGSGDSEYEDVWREAILPAVRGFSPEIMLISAGFDAHRDDPLAQMELSTPFFGWMTERVVELAERHCQGRLISLLEGGYDLRALSQSVALHLAILHRAAATERPNSAAGP